MRLALLIVLLFSPLAAHADPVTAAIVAFAAFATTTIGIITIATVVLSTGMAVYGSAQARRAERNAQNARNAAMQDRMATRIASESPHRYIYGRARVGSDIVAMFTSGDKDQYKHIVCVLAAHECDAVEEVYINNVALGLLTSDGDVISGRYAPAPGREIAQESHSGTTFTLNKYPLAGSVKAFSGTGAHMVEVAVSSVSGRNVTLATAGTVIVSYQYAVKRRFDDEVDDTTPATTNPYVRVQIHLGGATDPADDYLMSVVPGKWTATAVLRGLTYLVVTLDLNNPEFQNGQVPIQALVRGRKLYDPRTELSAWSANPALGVYDYLTSPLCGVPATDLPVAQFITAANVCDELVVSGEPRYTMNGTVTSDQGQSGVLEAMAECMGGGIVSTSWDIHAGKYIAPVAALLQSDIVGAISITPGVSDAAIYNGVKGQYLSDENGYVLTDFKPYQNATYRVDDGRDLYTNIDFPFTNTLQRVTNLARIFTEDQRNGFTLKAEFSLKAWSLKVGQRITFTSAYLGQSSKIYRITDKSYAPNSAVELTLKEDDPSIWDFADAVTLDSTPNTDLPDPWKIAPIASLACTSGAATLLRQADGSIVPRILVSWPVATTQAVFTNGQIEIEWRAISTDTWQKTVVSGSDTDAYLSPITPGFFYVVRARTVNPYLNTKSDWVSTTYQVAVFTASTVVYKWAATMPAVPAGASSYAWSTSAISAVPSGWSASIPAAPAGGNSTLWAASVLVSDISASGSTPFDWSASDVAVIGYSPTAAGYSNASVYAYQRAASAPAGTPGAVVYDFASGTITTATLANGWQKTIPAANGNPLYVTAASASAAGATDAIAAGEWSGAVILARDGSNGSNGSDGGPGLNNATVTIYQRAASATAPALPSVATTYTFATGALTGLNNGWTQYIPSSGGAYLHTSLATAAATTATDSIAAGEWAAVQLMYDAAAVTAAQTAADAAQAAATAANSALTAVGSDNVLSKGEKPAEILRWNSIVGEFGGLQIQADSLGVSHITIDNAYSALFNHLSSLNTAPAWTDVLVDTPIDGALFRTTFLSYFNAKAALLNAIAAKIQANTSAAQSSSDAANTALAAIFADNVLSRDEKTEIVRRMGEKGGEYNGIVAQAAALSVSSTAYVAANAAVNAYLTALWPAYDDLTQNTTIVRADANAAWNNYYTAKMSLLSAIAAKAATQANSDGIITAPGGGILIGQNGGMNGAIKIRLPQSWTGTMLKFTVDIFEYLAGYSCVMDIAGYNYNGYWYNVTARVRGGSNVEYPVYFGHDGTKCCIWIGNASESWSYPQVRVKDVFLGFTNTSEAIWASGWQISFDTAAAANVTASVLDTLPGADWSKIPNRAGKPADGATVGATFGSNVFGQITAGNVGTYLALAAIGSGYIADLRTANYAEDGSGNATAGAKLSSTGTALKVANNSLQVGSAIFSDYWFRLVQGIDGSVAAGKVIWRGNNDSTTRGGAPNIACLTITAVSSQLVQSNFQQIYHSYKIAPSSYAAYTDNLDAMCQIHVQLFQSSSSASPFTEFYQPCPSRTYDGSTGAVQGSWHWGWRYSGTGSVVSGSLETGNVYSGYMRVRLANSYGFSAAQDFAPASSGGQVLSATTISGTAPPPSGGGGGSGGGCPAPWVKVTLHNGKEVNAGSLYNGAVVAAVDDNTMQPLPNGGTVRGIAVIWAQRYRVKLADGAATEWSENHRFAVKDRGWVHVQNLLPGDHILGLKEGIVDSLLATGEGQVVSFEVEGGGTYFAGGLLCHNIKNIP